MKSKSALSICLSLCSMAALFAFGASDVKPRIVVRGVFWPNEWKDACMKRAAERHSIPFVKADFGSADENAMGSDPMVTSIKK